MKITEYLKTLIKADTPDSSKSFALVVSVLVGAFLGLCVAFCLVWDVCKDGKVDTDLEGLAWFLGGVAFFMAGGGINKALATRKIKKEEVNK